MSNIKNIEAKILEAQHAYYNSLPIMSDEAYDLLLDELKALDSNHSLIKKVGAVPTSEWKKARHLIPMGSLDKVQNPIEMFEWVSSVSKNQPLIVTEKLDGFSIELVYEDGKFVQAITRGDGENGEDITVNVHKMNGVLKTIPEDFNGSIRGEIVLRRSKHKQYFPTYANPRNAVGVCKRLDGTDSEHLDVFMYQVIGSKEFSTELEQFNWLKSVGAQVPNFQRFEKDIASAVNDYWDVYQKTTREQLDYDIDGLVVSIDDLSFQSSLGSKDLRPRGKIAFKFLSEKKKSVLRNIVWSVGNTGRVVPNAEFDPVNIIGANISNASLYNYAYIQKLKLDIGAEVLISRANDVIPRVEEVILGTNTIAERIKSCPTCSTELVIEGEYLQCPNSDGCPSQASGRIKNWVSNLNLLELGETLIERLVESGKVKNIADLYTITVSDLCSIERMAEKSAQNVYNSIHSKMEITLEELVGSLSIPLVAVSMMKMVTQAGFDTLGKLFSASAKDFERIPGLGPAKSKSLYTGLVKNKDLIERILGNGITIKGKIQGALSGKSVCFTGAMVNKRPVLEEMAKNAGAEVKGSVGKNLSFLVIADPVSTSSKAVAARRNGATCISEEEFLKMVQ